MRGKTLQQHQQDIPVGTVFGNWATTVLPYHRLYRAAGRQFNKVYVDVRCPCGSTRSLQLSHLLIGRTTGCSQSCPYPLRKEVDGVTHKRCPKCEVYKPATLDFFGPHGRVPDGLLSWCRECTRGIRGPHWDKVRAIKESMPCADCGLRYPAAVMDFDHLDASEKTDAVSQMIRRVLTWETIEAEIAKCELVCSNCHRIRTWNRAHPEDQISLGDFAAA